MRLEGGQGFARTAGGGQAKWLNGGKIIEASTFLVEARMTEVHSHVAQNTVQRERLRALINRLSDEDLRRPVSAGWTIAGVLAHVAFWDQRVLVLLERWERGGPGSAPRPFNRDDVDWINDAAKGLCLALPPRVAAQLALSTAEAVDRKVEALPADLLTTNVAAGNPINLNRAEHRHQHLDEIERTLVGEGHVR